MSAKPNTTDWKSINLKKTKRHVTNLQKRIYLASKNGDKKKVRDLQWILTDPKSGRFLIKMSWFKHRDYIMIKHDFSPYDRTKIEYFENRKENYYF